MVNNKRSIFLTGIFLVILSLLLFFLIKPVWAGDVSNIFNGQVTSLEKGNAKVGLKATSTERVEMYRLYNKYSGEHFYTSDTNEKKTMISAGWTDEGTGWFAPKVSKDEVYRVYNPNSGDHHYTLDKNEYNQLGKAGWKQEGIGWYSAEEGSVGRVPLYRQYNPYSLTGNHNYTTKTKERDALIKAGWKDEKIGWYGFETADSATKAIDFSKGTIVDTSKKTYCGKQYKPKVTITGLKEGQDFTVTYSDNINAGTGKITVKGKGKYTGEKTYYFTIARKQVTISGIKAKNKFYDGTKAATLDCASVKLTGVLSGDNLTVNVSATGEFGDKEVGDNKAVNITYSVKRLSGSSVGNYELARSGHQAIATANIKEPINVTFETLNHGNEKFIKSPNIETLKLSAPTQAEYGTSAGLKFEGWYENDSCTGNKVDFNSRVFTSSVTLYANWVPDSDQSSFWLAPAMTRTTTSATGVKNSSYVKEQWNVKKSSKEIKDDIETIKKEIKEGTDGNAKSVTNEYKAYMINDTYHLYTMWNGMQATWGENENTKHTENAYVEFRILEVNGESGHVGDGAVLTFQAVHILPMAQKMNANDTNVGGWANSLLLDQLKSGGSVYSNFNQNFLNSIKEVFKSSTKGSGQTILGDEAKSKFWIASNVELTGTSESGYEKEGSQYTFWNNRLGIGKDTSILLTMKTRSGHAAYIPAGGSGSSEGTWWLRSPFISSAQHFLRVAPTGNTKVNVYASNMFGVVPCFCLG